MSPAISKPTFEDNWRGADGQNPHDDGCRKHIDISTHQFRSRNNMGDVGNP